MLEGLWRCMVAEAPGVSVVWCIRGHALGLGAFIEREDPEAVERGTGWPGGNRGTLWSLGLRAGQRG